MLPLRDRNPSGVIPWGTYGVIAANVLVFLLEMGMSGPELNEFAMRFGLVPERVTNALRGDGSLLANVAVPAFSSMFLHGGIAHVLGNLWFLFIFGDNVQGRVGHVVNGREQAMGKHGLQVAPRLAGLAANAAETA